MPCVPCQIWHFSIPSFSFLLPKSVGATKNPRPRAQRARGRGVRSSIFPELGARKQKTAKNNPSHRFPNTIFTFHAFPQFARVSVQHTARPKPRCMRMRAKQPHHHDGGNGQVAPLRCTSYVVYKTYETVSVPVLCDGGAMARPCRPM